MQIGILGTGIVGQTLGLKLVQLGHSVMLGTRDPAKLDEPKGHGSDARSLRQWLVETGSKAAVTSFREAVANSEIIINALRGASSLEVLQAVAQGRTSREIGEMLYISENTVKNHVRNILDKLGLHSRGEAVMYALREDLIQID